MKSTFYTVNFSSNRHHENVIITSTKLVENYEKVKNSYSEAKNQILYLFKPKEFVLYFSIYIKFLPSQSLRRHLTD